MVRMSVVRHSWQSLVVGLQLISRHWPDAALFEFNQNDPVILDMIDAALVAVRVGVIRDDNGIADSPTRRSKRFATAHASPPALCPASTLEK